MIDVVFPLVPACELGFFLVGLCEQFHKAWDASEAGRVVSRLMGIEFTPIFLLIVVGVSVALGMFAASAILGPKKQTAVKQMPYESGMDPIGDARQRFDVRYYLVAIVFLLFDVELLFLYPWAVAQWSASPPVAAVVQEAKVGSPAVVAAAVAGIPPIFRNLVFGEILVFVAILAAGFAYAWRKGVFEWR
jgi:NADH-quinone oxidoreductase subunit A